MRRLERNLKEQGVAEKVEAKRPASAFKKMVASVGIITCLVLNPGCKIRDSTDLERELDRKSMERIVEQKENFSKLLYDNVETHNGKKYVLIRNLPKGIIDYGTEFSSNNFFNLGIKNTGEPHLTANDKYVYAMFENGDMLAGADTRKNKTIGVELGGPQTNVSMAASEEWLFYYSKERGLELYSTDLSNYQKVDLKYLQTREGKVERLFLNKSTRGIMAMGDGFSSIYFINTYEGEIGYTQLKLKGYSGKIENPRVVEYNRKYYIKPEKENYVLEFDYNGNFVRKMDIPEINE
ncbi:MAG: hypothetical protein QXU54_02635 [Candidatus Micrarchaeia archaeon]